MIRAGIPGGVIGNEESTRHDFSNGMRQILDDSAFENITCGAHRKGRIHIATIFEDGDDNDFASSSESLKLPGDLYSVEVRHKNIEEDKVWPMANNSLQR